MPEFYGGKGDNYLAVRRRYTVKSASFGESHKEIGRHYELQLNVLFSLAFCKSLSDFELFLIKVDKNVSQN